MTQYRSVVILVVSVMVGATSVWTVSRWADQRVAGAFTPMIVAARDIAPGERLGSENMRQVDWPKSSMPSGSFRHAAMLEGRVASQALVVGEPILEQRLAAVGSRAGLNSLITPGRRAMTVKVNEVVGVAGFALPGNYVDVLVTVNHNAAPPTARTVLERVAVLAVAQDHSVKDETKPRVVSAVTLEVTPEQAERLDLARSIGSLSMVLRNQTDNAPVATGGAVVADILRGAHGTSPSREPVMRELQNGPAIEIIRGVQRSNIRAI